MHSQNKNTTIPSLEEIKNIAKNSDKKYNIALQELSKKHGFKNYQSFLKYDKSRIIQKVNHLRINEYDSHNIFDLKNLKIIGVTGSGKTILLKDLIVKYIQEEKNNILITNSYNEYTHLFKFLKLETKTFKIDKIDKIDKDIKLPNPFVFKMKDIEKFKQIESYEANIFAQMLKDTINSFYEIEISLEKSKLLIQKEFQKVTFIKEEHCYLKISEIIKSNNLLKEVKLNQTNLEIFDEKSFFDKNKNIKLDLNFIDNIWNSNQELTLIQNSIYLYLQKMKTSENNLIILEELWKYKDKPIMQELIKEILILCKKTNNAIIVTSQMNSDFDDSLYFDNQIIMDYKNLETFIDNVNKNNKDKRDLKFLKDLFIINEKYNFILFKNNKKYSSKEKNRILPNYKISMHEINKKLRKVQLFDNTKPTYAEQFITDEIKKYEEFIDFDNNPNKTNTYLYSGFIGTSERNEFITNLLVNIKIVSPEVNISILDHNENFKELSIVKRNIYAKDLTFFEHNNLKNNDYKIIIGNVLNIIDVMVEGLQDKETLEKEMNKQIGTKSFSIHKIDLNNIDNIDREKIKKLLNDKNNKKNYKNKKRFNINNDTNYNINYVINKDKRESEIMIYLHNWYLSVKDSNDKNLLVLDIDRLLNPKVKDFVLNIIELIKETNNKVLFIYQAIFQDLDNNMELFDRIVIPKNLIYQSNITSEENKKKFNDIFDKLSEIGISPKQGIILNTKAKEINDSIRTY